jgi:hypothetical protein
MKSVKDFGEPGFIFSDSKEFLFNPCVTGDTLLTCKDHGLMREGELESNGVEYQMPIEQYVKLFETTDLPPMVLSYNIKTGEKEWAPVTAAALTRKNADVIQLDLENGKTIKLTPDHKVYTENRGWIEAKDLTDTDILVSNDGDTVQKTQNVKKAVITNEDVYDITVPGNHNFFGNGIVVHNCVEIGMLPITESGESGFQFCNLTEINGGKCESWEDFEIACKAASILGTLQAGYTNFKYLSDATKQITDREALIGVSITGWMNNPEILFDKENMIKGANLVKQVNAQVSKIIGINQAARTTAVKPSGNACTKIETEIKTELGIMSMESVFKHITDGVLDIHSLPEKTYITPEVPLRVYDENNSLKDISAFYINGITETYDITFEDGKTYSFTGNHKLKTTTGWKYVADLTEDDVIESF